MKDQTVRLGDVTNLAFGNAFQSSLFSEEPVGPRLLRGDNIGFGGTRWTQTKYWPEELSRGLQHLSLSVGDVVLAMDRPWLAAGLKYAFVRTDDLPALLVQRTARLRGGNRLDQGYLRWVLASRDFAEYVLAIQTGTTIPHISGRQIADYPVPWLPSIMEQRAIASILGWLDDKMESNRRLVTAATAELKGLADAVSDLPAVPLSSIATSSKDLVDPSILLAQTVEHFSIPAFDVDGMPEICNPSTIKSGKFAIEGPRVLVSRLNPRITRVWYAVPTTGTGMASTEFLVLAGAKAGSLAGVWLAVTDNHFTAELQRRATGTSGSHQRIRPADALSIDVRDTRRADAALVAEADTLLSLVHHTRVESRSLAALRDNVLPELLSGRLRVPGARGQVEGVA